MNLSTLFRIFLFSASCLVTSCQTATPEKCFDVAVLNANTVVGFACGGMWRELESPSVKTGRTPNEVLPMQRSEVVAQKIKLVEENYEQVKLLKPTDDAKSIVDASMALHEYILPVYKNEYTQLAKLFDSGAPKAQLEQAGREIQAKHAARFAALYRKLIGSGKEYAAQYNIPVKWAL